MRLQTFLVLFFSLLLGFLAPIGLKAGVEVSVDTKAAAGMAVSILNGQDVFGGGSGSNPTFNEMTIDKLTGTIMDQPADGSKPFALETLSVVNKGDVLTVYDQSWVILKSHNGDRIGLDANTVAVVDEFYIQGPDRQVRFLLQKGIMMFRVNGRDSRQSFFEINTGSEVTAINDTRCILAYDAAAEKLDVKYLTGRLTVLDKDNEEKFKVEHSENFWKAGKMVAEEPSPLDELDVINFNKFFEGEPRLKPQNNSFLLPGSN